MGSLAPKDIERGFQVEEPLVFVPWGITEAELRKLLDPHTNVTAGYVTCACRALGGLSCQLGFHFEPRSNGTLHELEFFRRTYPDERASFDEFQSHLETTFGSPHRSEPGILEYPDFEWQFGAVLVKHRMGYRFMSEEHVRIRKASPPAG